MSPAFVGNDIAFIRKDKPSRHSVRERQDGSEGTVARRRMVARRFTRGLSQSAQAAPPYGKPMWSRLPGYELRLGGMQPSFSPSGDRYAAADYVPSPVGGNTLSVVDAGNKHRQTAFSREGAQRPRSAVVGERRSDHLRHRPSSARSSTASTVSSSKPAIASDGGAQIAMINVDGTGFREVDDWPEQQWLPIDVTRWHARSSIARSVPRARACAS